MDAVAEWVFVIYKQDINDNFIFKGPYTIESFTEDQIDLIPSKYYIDGLMSLLSMTTTTAVL
jgi:hypothetical protein